MKLDFEYFFIIFNFQYQGQNFDQGKESENFKIFFIILYRNIYNLSLKIDKKNFNFFQKNTKFFGIFQKFPKKFKILKSIKKSTFCNIKVIKLIFSSI